MKNFITFLVISIVGMLLSGCASSVYYNTELDPTANITQSKKFRVVLPKTPTIEDKKFMMALNRELHKQGFNVAGTSGPIDYGVFFTLANKSYNGVGTYTTYKPTTSYSSGYVGNTYVSGTTTSSVPVSNTYSYTNSYKKIFVEILSTRKNSQGSYDTVWTGFMSIKLEEYEKNREAMVAQLVQLIGKEFKGDILVEASK